MSGKMKAAVCTAYGPPEVVKITEIDKPVPKENELLIKTIAATLNSGDSRLRGLKGGWFIRLVIRLLFGFSTPKKPVLGLTFSGVVEEVGSKVTNFKPGDVVFGSSGSKMGAHAEYIAVSDKAAVTQKPGNATFDEAAALLFGGMTAIYFLQKAGIATGKEQKVLIYGATGAVGAAAVQIAKYYRAHVTSVCSNRGAELAKSLGSDRIIIYTEEDFTKLNKQFDIIFDAVGKTKKSSCTDILKKDGRYITVASFDVAKETHEQVILLKKLFETGKMKAVIDKVFSLDDIVEAHRYVDTESKKGNVVINMSA